jgi:hypothetical protein
VYRRVTAGFGNIDRSIAQIDGVILAFLDHRHPHCVDENFAIASTSSRPVSDMF